MLTDADRAILDQSKLFRHISIDAVEEVLADCPVYALAPGDVLIEPEQENHAVCVVLEGSLSAKLAGRETFEVTHLGPGECVGEISMVDGQRARPGTPLSGIIAPFSSGITPAARALAFSETTFSRPPRAG